MPISECELIRDMCLITGEYIISVGDHSQFWTKVSSNSTVVHCSIAIFAIFQIWSHISHRISRLAINLAHSVWARTPFYSELLIYGACMYQLEEASLLSFPWSHTKPSHTIEVHVYSSN